MSPVAGRVVDPGRGKEVAVVVSRLFLLLEEEEEEEEEPMPMTLNDSVATATTALTNKLSFVC